MEEPHLIFVSKNLDNEELIAYVVFLHELQDVFKWTYVEMLGLDPSIAIHFLNIKSNVKAHQQLQKWAHPDVMDQIEKEVKKLIDVGFIRKKQHLN